MASAADTDGIISDNISYFPPVYATIIFMIAESALYMFACIKIDSISVQNLPRIRETDDPTFDPRVLDGLDEDVVAEREATLKKFNDFGTKNVMLGGLEAGNSSTNTLPPLCIDRLRKVFPPKKVGAESVVATEDACFSVESGEIFGLLGGLISVLYDFCVWIFDHTKAAIYLILQLMGQENQLFYPCLYDISFLTRGMHKSLEIQFFRRSAKVQLIWVSSLKQTLSGTCFLCRIICICLRGSEVCQRAV